MNRFKNLAFRPDPTTPPISPPPDNNTYIEKNIPLYLRGTELIFDSYHYIIKINFPRFCIITMVCDLSEQDKINKKNIKGFINTITHGTHGTHRGMTIILQKETSNNFNLIFWEVDFIIYFKVENNQNINNFLAKIDFEFSDRSIYYFQLSPFRLNKNFNELCNSIKNNFGNCKLEPRCSISNIKKFLTTFSDALILTNRGQLVMFNYIDASFTIFKHQGKFYLSIYKSLNNNPERKTNFIFEIIGSLLPLKFCLYNIKITIYENNIKIDNTKHIQFLPLMDACNINLKYIKIDKPQQSATWRNQNQQQLNTTWRNQNNVD